MREMRCNRCTGVGVAMFESKGGFLCTACRDGLGDFDGSEVFLVWGYCGTTLQIHDFFMEKKDFQSIDSAIDDYCQSVPYDRELLSMFYDDWDDDWDDD